MFEIIMTLRSLLNPLHHTHPLNTSWSCTWRLEFALPAQGNPPWGTSGMLRHVTPSGHFFDSSSINLEVFHQ